MFNANFKGMVFDGLGIWQYDMTRQYRSFSKMRVVKRFGKTSLSKIYHSFKAPGFKDEPRLFLIYCRGCEARDHHGI